MHLTTIQELLCHLNTLTSNNISFAVFDKLQLSSIISISTDICAYQSVFRILQFSVSGWLTKIWFSLEKWTHVFLTIRSAHYCIFYLNLATIPFQCADWRWWSFMFQRLLRYKSITNFYVISHNLTTIRAPCQQRFLFTAQA